MINALLLLLFLAVPQTQTNYNYALREELLQMVQNDQAVIGHAKVKVWSGKDSVEVADIAKLNPIHNKRLKQIFSKYGYPDYDLVMSDGEYAFWLLVQHQTADVRFQKKVLAAMEEKVKAGKASKRNFAYLTDRVLILTGKQQLYGTQLDNAEKGKRKPLPLFEPEKVNERRVALGLDSLESYLKFANDTTLRPWKRNEK